MEIYLIAILVICLSVYLYKRNKKFNKKYVALTPLYKRLDSYIKEVLKSKEKSDEEYQLLVELKNKHDYLTITNIQYLSKLILIDKNFSEARKDFNRSLERGECRLKVKTYFIFGIVIGLLIPILYSAILEVFTYGIKI